MIDRIVISAGLAAHHGSATYLGKTCDLHTVKVSSNVLGVLVILRLKYSAFVQILVQIREKISLFIFKNQVGHSSILFRKGSNFGYIPVIRDESFS